MTSADHDPEQAGGRVVGAATAATAAFVAATAAAVVWPGPVRAAAAGFDVALFGAGLVLFLAGLVVAAGRSRTETVTLGGTLLAGTAPPAVRRRLWLLLGVQCVVAVVAAAARPYTAVAFAVLAPMSIFGAMAWWGARHGRSAADDATVASE